MDTAIAITVGPAEQPAAVAADGVGAVGLLRPGRVGLVVVDQVPAAAGEVADAVPLDQIGQLEGGRRPGRRRRRVIHQLVRVLRVVGGGGLPGEQLVQIPDSRPNLRGALCHGRVGLPAQSAPDCLPRLAHALSGGSDRGGDGGVDLGSLGIADQQLHPSDADRRQQKDENQIAFPFSGSFRIFHGSPLKN